MKFYDTYLKKDVKGDFNAKQVAKLKELNLYGTRYIEKNKKPAPAEIAKPKDS